MVGFLGWKYLMWEEVVRLCMCFESIFIDMDYRRNRLFGE